MNAEAVYDNLREAIATGRLHPNERLVESDLAEEFGTTRAAVRIALLRLQQERLVEHERNRGARVRPVSEDEAVEIYETRAVLEALTAGRAAESATDVDVDRLRTILARTRRHLDTDEFLAASESNIEFHGALVGIAQHATVERLLATLNPHLVRYHYRTILQPDRPEKSFAEHSAIVAAIERRDARAAERAMWSHLSAATATMREPQPHVTGAP